MRKFDMFITAVCVLFLGRPGYVEEDLGCGGVWRRSGNDRPLSYANPLLDHFPFVFQKQNKRDLILKIGYPT